MQSDNFKIYIEKSWSFTRQVLILIIIGIVAIILVSALIWQLTKSPFPEPQLPEEKKPVMVPPRTEEDIKKQPPELRVPAIGIEIEEE
jgi:hypothetical protein